MLTLTRRLGEDVVLELEDGQLIRVTVKEVRRGQVRLGFKAPREVRIDRAERLENDRVDEDDDIYGEIW